MAKKKPPKKPAKKKTPKRKSSTIVSRVMYASPRYIVPDLPDDEDGGGDPFAEYDDDMGFGDL